MDEPGPLLQVFPLLGVLWVASLGLVIGSFLNVVIARVPHGQSVVKPRSRCPRCGHSLPWYENIPVFSWLALRGRCSGCREPISPRYPLVELMTGVLFVACLQRFGWTWELVSALVLVCLLIPLTFIDLEHWILPFALTLPGIVLGIVLAVPLGLERLRDAIIGAVVAYFVFWGMEWVGEKIFQQEALGGGDKYLLAMLGAFLTYKSLLGLVFLSSLQGALVGVVMLLVRGRAGPEYQPLGEGAPPGERPPQEVSPATPVSAAVGPELSPEATPAEGTGLSASPSAEGAQAPETTAAPMPAEVAAPAAPVPSEAAAAPIPSEAAAAPVPSEVAAAPAAPTPAAGPGETAAPVPSEVAAAPAAGPGETAAAPVPPESATPPLSSGTPVSPEGASPAAEASAEADEEEEDDWTPGPTNMPFGPWLAVAGLELMLLGPWLQQVLPRPISLFLVP
jgi:leader peptidase (prepilin peptidase)/N-methyltransferase